MSLLVPKSDIFQGFASVTADDGWSNTPRQAQGDQRYDDGGHGPGLKTMCRCRTPAVLYTLLLSSFWHLADVARGPGRRYKSIPVNTTNWVARFGPVLSSAPSPVSSLHRPSMPVYGTLSQSSRLRGKLWRRVTGDGRRAKATNVHGPLHPCRKRYASAGFRVRCAARTKGCYS